MGLRFSAPGAAPSWVVLTAAMLAAGCGEAPGVDDQRALYATFPAHAAEVLDRGGDVAEEGGSFVLASKAASAHFRGAPLRAKIARDDAGLVTIETSRGFAIEVREERARGSAARTSRAVAFRREGGVSYWLSSPRGAWVEEWLHLAPGAARAGEVAAAWRVSGGDLREANGVVEIVDASGALRLRVSAPRAFTAAGRFVEPSLRARGDRIELTVDAGGAEVLIDPMWVDAGLMNLGRSFFTTDTLLDVAPFGGDALVAGGFDDFGSARKQSDRFDVQQLAWMPGPPLACARAQHASSVMPDGRVLLSGGSGDFGQPSAKKGAPSSALPGQSDGVFVFCGSFAQDSAEVYDPFGDLFTPVAYMNFGRQQHTSTALDDGRVMVTGGAYDGATSSVEIYDPAGGPLGSWSYFANMSTARQDHAASKLQDGRVLVSGGYAYAGSETSEVYDPINDLWVDTGTFMNQGRQRHTSTTLQDGRVLVTGGVDDFGTGLTSVEIYDPASDAWSMVAPLSLPRVGHTATLLPGGGVLVAGGIDGFGYGGGVRWDSAEVYDPANDLWVDVGPMIFTHYAHGAALLGDKSVIVAGSDDYGAQLDVSERFVLDPGGTPCSTSLLCASGFCVDGVCCDSACAGTCSACSAALKGGGADGVCEPVANGTDPDNECDATPASTCDNDGACDGAGACRKHISGTVCAASSCAAGVQQNADKCDGAGACLDGGTTSCGKYVCGSTACLTSCANDAQCITTAYCQSTTCVDKKPDGAACGGANECQSASCVDGVCCNTACAGLCQACTAAKKGGGADGACGPVAAGSDPDSECAAQAAATCGNNGQCDGAGACQKYAAGTVCVSQSCAGSTQQNADTCNGSGTCVDGGTTSCGNYLCGVNACLTSCTNDTQCVATAFCQGMTCVSKKPDGAACGGANECQSASCADGVCCNTACAGLCQACTAAKKGVGADGACGPVAAGSDPDSECAAQAASTCGNNGQCDGAGACQKHAAGTVCVPQSCAGSTQQNADTCNGAGSCVDSGTTSCGNYVCGATACLSVCASDNDCIASAFCQGTSCLSKKPDGALCSTNNECQSAHCTDGVCCNTACGGLCQACTAAKKGSGADGTCGPITAGNDPDNECAQQPASSCGDNGQCDGAGACQKYVAGTICQGSVCLDASTQQNAKTCDGIGSCNDNGTTSCGNFQCAGGICLSTCTGDMDCGVSGWCDIPMGQPSGTCAPKKTNGQACAGQNQCQSTFCASAVCCDAPCNGACNACSVGTGAPTDGTCAPISGAACDDGNACTNGDVCQSGVCQGSAVTCPASDACHDDGACDPTNGQCMPAPKPDGAMCDDGDACTSGDSCKAGACAAGAPVICGGAGSCHDAGVCDPVQGCTSAVKPNGTPCDDGDLCTSGQTCLDGVCSGGSAVDCSTLLCQVGAACDPTTGKCVGVALPDGTLCTGGACLAGVCVPDPQGGLLAGASSSGGMGGAGGQGGAGSSGTSSGTSTSSGASSGAGGEGGDRLSNYRLQGGGCSVDAAGRSGESGGLFGIALGIAAWVCRRRRSLSS